jgi:hypothetical protein
VDGYINGTIEEVDTSYLESLSDDAVEPLRRLAQQAPDSSVRKDASQALGRLENVESQTPWSLRGI